jgi:hypothetical protein
MNNIIRNASQSIKQTPLPHIMGPCGWVLPEEPCTIHSNDNISLLFTDHSICNIYSSIDLTTCKSCLVVLFYLPVSRYLQKSNNNKIQAYTPSMFLLHPYLTS